MRDPLKAVFWYKTQYLARFLEHFSPHPLQDSASRKVVQGRVLNKGWAEAESLNEELFPRLNQDERALVAALGAPIVHDAFQVLLERYIQSANQDMAERILAWFPKKGEFALSINHWVVQPPGPAALKTVPYILDYDMKLDDRSLHALLTWLHRSEDRAQFEQFLSHYGARLSADDQAKIMQ